MSIAISLILNTAHEIYNHRLDFGAKFNLDPTSIEGDGDGTVNAQSLIGCKYWKNTTNHKIYIQEFPGEDHVGILNHYGVIDYILNAVAN